MMGGGSLIGHNALLKIAIAEDDDHIRTLLVNQLNGDPRVEILISARNGQELVDAIQRVPVDAVLLDVEMPVMDGVETIKALRSQGIEAKILMLTAFERKSRLMESLSAGAQAFLTKDIAVSDLVDAVVNVCVGKEVLSAQATSYTTGVMRGLYSRIQDSSDWYQRVSELPEKYRPVYEQLIQGKTNYQIAREVHLSEGSVRTYVTGILMFLECHSRAEVIRRASLAETVDIPL